MALGPYNFFRGTVLQFTRDMIDQPGRFPTSFSTPESSRVLLVGDPHYENIGTYRRSDGQVLLDFNDFDAASVGPYHLDVRRLALSFYVALVQIDYWRSANAVEQGAVYAPLTTEEQRIQLASLVAAEYAVEVMRLTAGAEPLLVRYQSGFGAIVDDIMRRAIRDGEIREELDEYTVVQADGSRTFVLGDREPEYDGIIGDRLLAPSPQVENWLVESWNAYPPTLVQPEGYSPQFFTIKDIAQRFGAGVSSYPLLRYYVLVEGPTSSVEDDVVLEIKEVGDPVQYPELAYFPYPRFPSNAERVATYQRALQETPENDSLLGWLDGPGVLVEEFRLTTSSSLGFRVRNRTKFQKGMDVSRLLSKLVEADWTLDDLNTFAALSGRLLASRHAAGVVPGVAEPALSSIATVIGGREQAFTAEMRAFITFYGPLLVEDYQRFAALLRSAGPLLGIRTSPYTRAQQ